MDRSPRRDFDVKTEPEDVNRAAVAVVGGVRDELIVGGEPDLLIDDESFPSTPQPTSKAEKNVDTLHRMPTMSPDFLEVTDLPSDGSSQRETTGLPV